jgi:hypothetical protein
MAHGLIEDRDRNLVVAIVVEDNKVAGHDLVVLAEPPPPAGQVWGVTRVNSTNILNEGLRIGETGRWMNSKVK